MNKKFLSAILFGALMVTSTGTFVSCKDYDDDINNLQEQINKLATKEDMTSQIASLQAALTAAQSEAAAAKASADQALAKVNSAESAATEAEKAAAQAAADAANAKVEAIKAAQEEVAKVKAELEAAINAKFEAEKKALAETIAKLTKQVEEMTGYTTEMLTDIRFESSTALDLNFFRIGTISGPADMFPNGAVTSYEFGKGMTGAFTVKNGDVNTVKDNMLINIAPVNAAVSAEALSLINGKGENLNDYVDLTVENYKANLTEWQSRANASTGLRKVGVQLKNTVDFEKFDKLVISGSNHAIDVNNCSGKHYYYKYALAVTDSKSRAVTSDFDVTMHVQKEKAAKSIGDYSYISSTGTSYTYRISDFANGADATANEGCFPAEVGENIFIEVRGEEGRIMASYVMVDYNYSKLSVTDKAALKGLDITGVDNVSKSNYHYITINDGAVPAVGIPVPLKVVAIDYTGVVYSYRTWVKVGEPALMTAEFDVTPTKHVDTPNNWAASSTMEEFEVPAKAASYSILWTIGETDHQSAKYIVVQNPKALSNISNAGLALYEADKTTQTTNPTKVAYAKFIGNINLQVMRENKAYEAEIKFYDATGTYIGSNTVSVKKVLPTVIPTGLADKTNIIHADGTMPIYPKLVNGKAEFALSNAFVISDALAADPNLTFETPSFKEGQGANEIATYGNQTSRKITVSATGAIGKDTKYPTTVEYNYGDILYHPEGHGVEEPDNCIVTWSTEFDIVFGCYVKDSQFAWATGATTSVIYNQEAVIYGVPAANKAANFMTAKNPYGIAIDPFDSLDTDWTDWAMYLGKANFVSFDQYTAANKASKFTIELWTNGENNEHNNEFFTADIVTVDNAGKVVESGAVATALRLTPNPSMTAKPENDVNITVVIKIQDVFGHAEAIKALTFTMKKDANTAAE